MIVNVLPKPIVYVSWKVNNDSPTDTSNYIRGDTGNIKCEDRGWLDITNKEECKTACDKLNITIEKLKDGGLCYVAGNGKCKQTGKAGFKASRICKKKGI